MIRDWYNRILIGWRTILVNKKLPVFGVFLLIASVFWLLSALGEKYHETVFFSARYINLPDDKMLVNELPEEYAVKISSTGYDILATKLKVMRNPVTISLSDASLVRRFQDSSRYFFFSHSLTPRFRESFSNDAVILSVSPDTVHVHYSFLSRKQVPVRIRVAATPKKQYQISGDMRTKPPRIEIAGPQAILDTIGYVKTVFLEFVDLSDSLVQMIPLTNPYENVSFSVDQVELVIPVEQFTESTLSLPVDVRDVPDSISVKLFPSRVQVTFRVGLTAYKLIDPDDFRVIVAYDSLIRANELTATVRPELEKYPVFVDQIRVAPEEIEYLLEGR